MKNHSRKKKALVIVYIIFLFLSIIPVFNVSALIWDIGVTYNCDNEYYSVTTPLTVDNITIDTHWFSVNGIGWNITESDNSWMNFSGIKSHPKTSTGYIVNWTATKATGIVTLNQAINGLKTSYTYLLYTNASSSVVVSSASGIIWVNMSVHTTNYKIYDAGLIYIYVSLPTNTPPGSDTTGTGTISNPYATLRKAINASSTSYTIVIRGGKYASLGTGTTQYLAINRSGTKTAPFTIRNYTGEKVVIDGSAYTIPINGGFIQFYKTGVYYNNITLYGINISNVTSGGSHYSCIKINGDSSTQNNNITLSHCSIYNVPSYAVQIYNTGATSYWVNYFNCNNCTFNKIQSNSTSDECFTLGGCKNYVFENNTILLFTKQFLNNAMGTCYGKIRYNSFMNKNYFSVKLDPAADGTNHTTHDIDVYGNYFYGTPTNPVANPVIDIYINTEISGNLVYNINIYNNIFNDSSASASYAHVGIKLRNEYAANTIRGITVKHNTFYVNQGSSSYNFYATANGGTISNCVVANNNFFTTSSTPTYQVSLSDLPSSQTNILFTNNLFYSFGGTTNGIQYSSGSGYGTNGYHQDPYVVNRNIGNFHLNTTSPCINNASSSYTVPIDYDGVSRPQSTYYDIGAYERVFGTGWTNTAPTFSGPDPANSSTGVNRYHATNVTIIDADSNQTSLVCFWYSLSASPYSWVKTQQNASISPGTIVRDINATYASGWVTQYWWKVTAYDGFANSSAIYTFTTKSSGIGAIGLTTYSFNPINDSRILPGGITPNDATHTYSALPSSWIKSNIFATTTPGEYIAATFVVKPNVTCSAFLPSWGNLVSGGNTISSSNIDIKGVKCWYQRGRDTYSGGPTNAPRLYVPELLLNDDDLIRVTYISDTSGWNRIREGVNSSTTYDNINNATDSSLAATDRIYDQATLQPLRINANEYKQYWITVYVPTGTAAGNYSGTITLKNDTTTITTMTVYVNVLSFTLPSSPIDYSLYYLSRGITTSPRLDSWSARTTTQYTAEFTDLKKHGIISPQIREPISSTDFDAYMSLRQAAGLSIDNVYFSFGDQLSAKTVAQTTTTVNNIKSWFSSHAYGIPSNYYFYVIDEADMTPYASQIAACRAAGGKTYQATDTSGQLTSALTYLDLDLICYPPTTYSYIPTGISNLHSAGAKAGIYGAPQCGEEKSFTFRRNYGINLWKYNYDVFGDYEYYGSDAVGWNDWEDTGSSTYYKCQCLAYPTSNGVVDTIAFEGLREGINDVRYIKKLQDVISSSPSSTTRANAWSYLNTTKATTWSSTADLDTIRSTVISYILSLSGSGSSPTVTTNTTTGITSSVATLNGYISSNGGNTITSYGFNYGTTTSMSSTYTLYGSKLGAYSGSLSVSPGQRYYVRAWATNSMGTGYGSTQSFITVPRLPTSLAATSYTDTTNYLTWTKGLGANYTQIKQNTDGTTSGTVIYNGTGSYWNQSSCTPGQRYYYIATSFSKWGTDGKWNTSTTTTNTVTKPSQPTSATVYIPANLSYIYLNCTQGTGTNNTVYVQKAAGYPTSPTDGTVIYNGTWTNQKIAYVTPGTAYFSAFSYAYWGTQHAWSKTGLQFIFPTMSGSFNPSLIHANRTTTSSMYFTWTKGVGATSTYIIRKIGSYPTSISDGTIIDCGALTAYNDSSLNPANHYFYKMYSYDGSSYSSGVNIIATETNNVTNYGSSWLGFPGYIATDRTVQAGFQYCTDGIFTTVDSNATEIQTGHYSITGSTTDTNCQIYYASWKGQSFLTGSDQFYITNVTVKLLRPTGYIPGMLYCRLYAADAAWEPTGAVLASGSRDANSISTTGEWFNITMSTYYLSASTRYCIILWTTAGSFNALKWFYATAYANGHALTSTDYGATWANWSTQDFLFKIYGSEPTPVSTYTTNSMIGTSGAFSITQTGLDPGQLYYYRARANDTAGNMTRGNTRFSLTQPNVPTFLIMTPSFSNSSLYITWMQGTGANKTVLVNGGSSYPTVSTDGTELYNGTGASAWLYNISFNTTYYLALFSYTTWAGLTRFSGAATIPWGGISFNCYNESSGLPINYSVLISNKAGSLVYYGPNLNGYHFINSSEIPMGDDIGFYVSNGSGDYNSRLYYFDIVPGVFYNFSFYLPVVLTPIIENDSYLYYLQVRETVYYSGYAYDLDVEGVSVIVKRYLASVDAFVTVGSMITDAAGIVNINLIPGTFYKVYLNKTGYYNSTNDYVPAPPNEWGQTETKLFKIVVLPSVSDDDDPYDNDDTVVLTATMYANNSLFIDFYSTLNGTCTATVSIYESYNYSRVLNATYNYLVCNQSLWYSPVNTSREYEVWLYLNYTSLDSVNYTRVQYVMPLTVHVYNATEIEKKITDVWGSWVPGFVNMFILFVPFVLIVVLVGKVEAGLGALGGGIWLIGINSLISNLQALNVYVVGVFVAAVGVILLLVKGGRIKL